MPDAQAHAMQVKLFKPNTYDVTALPLIGISPRDLVRKTFKGREACHPLSNINDSLRLLNFGVSKRLIWSRHFLILALRSKFCLKIFLRWLP